MNSKDNPDWWKENVGLTLTDALKISSGMACPTKYPKPGVERLLPNKYNGYRVFLVNYGGRFYMRVVGTTRDLFGG